MSQGHYSLSHKFVDYTKIDSIVDSEEGYPGLQRSLDQLRRWVKEWQMEFNSEKYKVLNYQTE